MQSFLLRSLFYFISFYLFFGFFFVFAAFHVGKFRRVVEEGEREGERKKALYNLRNCLTFCCSCFRLYTNLLLAKSIYLWKN